MEKPLNFLTFIPLDPASQGNSENVLYYNTNSSSDAIYECAMARLRAAANTLESLHEYHNPPQYALSRTAITLTFLLNDAIILLEELNPIAIKLRQENNQQKG